jgi:hypothetical protein
MRKLSALCLVLALLQPAWSQHRVDAGNLYHRVLAVVPYVGSGTWNDPKRPMFAPVGNLTDRTGIIAYQHQPSDDGMYALAEFVSPDRAALLPILNSTNPSVTAFEVGQHTQAEIQATFQQYAKAFSFGNFRPMRVQ